MGIVKNLRYINEEYETEVTRLERLNNFIASEEFKTGTDEEQKKLLLEKQAVLKKYVSIIAEQIKYDTKKVQAAEHEVENYEDIEGKYFNK
ncbi:Uncharacterised protein [Fusobacterium necrogenes]|uniref:Uncharacterized protein n=1 Tax=Fusobacterium necrogenes TaxID=858 RepID=A0A377GY19_9FUSO|nr:hypothetical protein [Fusobacterium necrogenes]STO31451.1 Uncharacterised protein [Fusobacterium necrogenes]